MPYELRNAANLFDLMQDLRKRYSDSGEKEILTPRFHNGAYSEKVGFSYIAGCPLETAFRKEGIKAPLPKRDYSYQVMDHGNYTSPMFVEPLVWEAKRSLDMAVAYEKFVETDEQHGYIDAMVTYRDHKGEMREAVIEIKDSDSPNGQIGTPKKQNCLQLIGYSLATGITDALFLLVQNKRGFDTYQLVLVDEEAYSFVLYDRWGNVYQPDYGEGWNTPEILNHKLVLDELGLIKQWRDKIRHWDYVRANERTQRSDAEKLFAEIIADRPIPDPLNEKSVGWRCIATLDKPVEYKTKENKLGTAVYNCQYAAWCHKVGKEPFEIGKKDAAGRLLFPHEIVVIE